MGKCLVCGKDTKEERNKYCSIECTLKSKHERYGIDFANRFNSFYSGSFVYVGGYQNCDSTIDCKCLRCGTVKHTTAWYLRHEAKIICDKCASKERLQQRVEEKKERAEKRKEEKKNKELLRIKERKQKLKCICEECGIEFTGNRVGLKYCSDECRNKHNNRYNEISRRHIIRSNGKIDWSISLARIAYRDKHICHICGEYVDMALETNDNMYGSIDHVIPVSKGGTHTWDNVMLAHRICNTIKSNSM